MDVFYLDFQKAFDKVPHQRLLLKLKAQMVNTVWVNADHGRDLHPLADHMTKLRIFTKEENPEFSAFPFSLQLMFDQTLSNLIVIAV